MPCWCGEGFMGGMGKAGMPCRAMGGRGRGREWERKAFRGLHKQEHDVQIKVESLGMDELSEAG